MKLPPVMVGEITPPDAFYKPVLHSEPAASAEFAVISKDIYDGTKSSAPLSARKTPTSVWCALGLIAAAAAFCAKKIIFKK
jgi:hypothetical protein